MKNWFGTFKWSFCLLIGVISFCTNAMSQGKTRIVKLITLDPAHFHAALIQKSAYPGVDSTVYVYAPANSQALKNHLSLIEGYNKRDNRPTNWNEIVYTGSDYFERMLNERKGNVVVLAGNNKLKTTYISKAVEARINVFSDKPMAINSAGFELLKKTFVQAEQKSVLLLDIMTERYQASNALQKELMQFPELFGTLLKGSIDQPAVEMESVHHFFKTVSGKPLQRPEWYFDVEQQGEGIVDVSTHLVDLVQWQCFYNQPLEYKKDIQILNAKRWPTVISKEQFTKVTGENSFPDYLQKDIKAGALNVYSNGEMIYKIKGVVVKLAAIWNYEAPTGAGDTHYSIIRGTKANLVIRQGAEQNFQPELFIEPITISESYRKNLELVIEKLASKYPGIGLEKTDKGWRILIPSSLQLDHETTFSKVVLKYIDYLNKNSVPKWEKQALLAKYFTTTEALKWALKLNP